MGRQIELDLARRRLLDPEVRLLTLSGPGGVGKTRLALAIADSLVSAFGDGVFFVDLAPVTDPSLVISTIAQALGVREEGGPALDEQVARFLRDKRLLLLLDNFEQVVDAAPAVVGLLSGSLHLKLLVTSRSLLRFRWEHELPVPPLALPDEHAPATLATVKASPAVALFEERARVVQPDFAIDARNARTIADICARLDGLPLAIELAAARIKLLTPEAILAWLERETGRSPFQLLTTDRRDLPSRHLALRAEIDWSYQLLDPAEQAFFSTTRGFRGRLHAGRGRARWRRRSRRRVRRWRDVLCP